MIEFGCIADDFTGASDAASFLVKGGLSSVLYNGYPSAEVADGKAKSLVVALKTRTQERISAVEDSLQAVHWLKAQGADQIYMKYCSTFDSTPEGNIGPILDAVLEELDCPYTILCPALPVNGRTIREGHLLVNDVPLHESSMRNHPLTPMWDSYIPNLMAPQSKYPTFVVDDALLSRPKEEIWNTVEGWGAEHAHFYLVPDCYLPHHLNRIAEVFGQLPVLSGGSGLLEPLAQQSTQNTSLAPPPSATSGSALILAGSCSQATLAQIAHFQKSGGKSYRIDPQSLLEGSLNAQKIWEQAMADGGQDILIYSSDTPDRVREAQQAGREQISELLENCTAQLAQLAVSQGVNRIIVAGGETSGAVTRGLKFQSYSVGESIAPGVPILIPLSAPDVRLVLKSGNFGQEDFFSRALAMTGQDDALVKKLDRACWIAQSLFQRGKTTGASANLSFSHGGLVYITRSGSCFGTLTPQDFSVISPEGTHLSGQKPSKEYPLHLAMYRRNDDIQAVIHTHATHGVLWSFQRDLDVDDCIPNHTPYLAMRLGKIALVPYHQPGSSQLFEAFEERLTQNRGYLLKQHGPVVGGSDLMDAFFDLEELEESARIAWELR